MGFMHVFGCARTTGGPSGMFRHARTIGGAATNGSAAGERG